MYSRHLNFVLRGKNDGSFEPKDAIPGGVNSQTSTAGISR